jgi:hypothetical protein
MRRARIPRRARWRVRRSSTRQQCVGVYENEYLISYVLSLVSLKNST